MKKLFVVMLAIMSVALFSIDAWAQCPLDRMVRIQNGKFGVAAEAVVFMGADALSKDLYVPCQLNGWLANGTSWATPERLEMTKLVRNGDWFEAPLANIGKGRVGVAMIGDPNLKEPLKHKWLPWEFLDGVGEGCVPPYLVKSFKGKGPGWELDLSTLERVIQKAGR